MAPNKMNGSAIRRVSGLTLLVVMGLFKGASAQATQAPDFAAPPQELETAKQLFQATCSSSFCHGASGGGGGGPSLKNRQFPTDFIRNTVMNGRPGTPMPAFKDVLDQKDIEQIVKFVAFLSPKAGAKDETRDQTADLPAMAQNLPLPAQATRGKELFFDAGHQASCSACHSFQKMGGPIGPDLVSIGTRAPAEIYQSIVHPSPGNQAYPATVIATSTGLSVAGVKRGDDDEKVQVFDLTAIPPVLRTFYKSDKPIQDTNEKIAPYVHDLNSFTQSDVLDLIAYLKSASGSRAQLIKPEDLGLPSIGPHESVHER